MFCAAYQSEHRDKDGGEHAGRSKTEEAGHK